MAEKKGGFNVVDLFMLGFGAIVGVGWSVTLNNWMGTGGGPGPAALGYAIATLGLIPVAFVYAELAPAIPVAGGAVAYSYKAFGDKMAFVAGWFLAMGYISIIPWEAIFICDIMAYILPFLKSGNPIYTLAGTDIFLPAIVMGLVLGIIIITVNWRGAGAAAKFQTGVTLLLLTGAALAVIFLFVKASPENLQPFYDNYKNKPHSSAIGGAMSIFAIAPFYFSGFDTIAQGAEDAGGVNPKNIGRVIVGALACSGALYCLMLISGGMCMPWHDFVQYQAPVVSTVMTDLYPGALGVALYWITMVAALTGLLSTWNGFYVAGSRLLMGLGRAALIPAFFAKQHPKYGTPWGGNIFCGVMLFVGPFLGIGLIDPLTVVGSTGFVISWGLSALCAYKLRNSDPDMNRPYRMPGGKGMAILASLLCAFFLVNMLIPALPGWMGKTAFIIFLCWAVLGLIFWFATAKYRNSIPMEERTKDLFQAVIKG